MITRPAFLALIGGLALAGCATAPGPVEVTRFVAPEASAQLGRGTIFVETAPGIDSDSLETAPYKAAVARELVSLGYVEAPRSTASQIAQVRVERFADAPVEKRGPVSVGVGGSTGSYGSGLGVGIGINLGGGPKEKVGTNIGVMIREAATNQTIWEGRACGDSDDVPEGAGDCVRVGARLCGVCRAGVGDSGARGVASGDADGADRVP